MKNVLLLTAAALVASSPAFAQAKALTGYATLLAIAQARGVQLNLATLQSVRPSTAQFSTLAGQLRISAEVVAQLLTYGNTAAPTNLVTRAALEAATGKTFTGNAVNNFLAQNPSLATNTPDGLSKLLSDPAALTAANKAAEDAQKAVTPTKPG
ncbi:hypothetical protein [Deinococcus peraridilitoris]|uniref:Uncharacterized protein n=1 Tax=Deinococcus peraridilitoris (strain DSM 19664 / LMG 22246 / CIP 109416 / KR-200) TaxID=937777 RepID=L0A8Y2_DEIPD|nr:hypothetical protein [Deinococcus peraridilitoris]AFZ69525.1 hypothetical protein Deipe_4158 [Deinococcus peraridilitoris DSM 19664]